jgi:hypothetical protein
MPGERASEDGSKDASRTNTKSRMESLASTLLAGISCTEDEFLLVAKEGKKFRINVELAEKSSPYFEALLNNGMRESGTKFSF